MEKLIQLFGYLVANPWILVKILFLAGLAMYLAFAIVVVRQVKFMSKTLNGLFDLPLRFFSIIHLLAAVGIFILALIIL